MLLYYKNSALASILSIFGCGMVIAGIMLFAEEEIAGGIGMIAFGIPFLIGGNIVSKNKAFKKWWKQIVAANLVPEIAKSTETAIAIYNKNPQKRTLKKIAELNPAAAAQIEQQLVANKTK